MLIVDAPNRIVRPTGYGVAWLCQLNYRTYTSYAYTGSAC